ncbi:MAG: hypothetical protein CSA66_05890 [Proteobacteria bacterium]|nr:MAG: hypothetical protein CSA66_05890 [Pseudomonadota bacterium]
MIFKVYIATSVDGFVATDDGGVGWLDAFAGDDHGYAEFIASVSTIVVGRRTYDQVRTLGGWPYANKRTVVLTSTPLEPDAAEDTAAWHGGVEELVARLREEPGDVWVLGGPDTLRAFREARAIDAWEIFLIPLLLGSGVPLFGGIAAPRELRLVDTRRWPNGVVRLRYTMLG